MISLIDRYLLQETLKTLLAVIIVLLLIFMSFTFIKLLKQVYVGDLNAAYLFQVLGFVMFEFLGRLLPPAFFIAGLFALGRMYRDSEIIALEACGVGGVRLFRSILFATLPIALMVGWLSMIVAPWSATKIAELISNQHGQEAQLAGIKPGRFNELKQEDLIFYVESIEREKRRMQNIFLQYRNKGEVGLISAASSYHKTDIKTGERYLVFEDGYRYQGVPGNADYKISKFHKFAIQIKKNQQLLIRQPWKSSPNSVLLASDNIRYKKEFQVRLSQIITVFVIAILVLALSHSTPRQGMYGQLAVAFIIYTFYLSIQQVAEEWMLDRVTPSWLGIWWVHLTFMLLALILMLRHSSWYWHWRRRLIGMVRK